LRNVQAYNLKLRGPPGDVYVCDPEDHKGDRAASMITILWAPMT